ncbi:hypothetical protein C7974DRAFT_159990 [Boeremia exigua]|uniref:uncharacterized protein n=1 Tax=Boeremia exigua TaxID=749465 RepID=UPI001E8D8CB2|nr:uncharacterized protein C7974DRAFT_159990 [Boeremia exigua]KAH6638398.1 hypothetical protein C7974DRAFT_159990 [Boeremia exigua]
MKVYIFVSLLAAMVTASPGFVTTTKRTGASAVAPTNFPPICTFDPVKGEYVCPDVSEVSGQAIKDTVPKAHAAAVAADCGKCQHDWDECMKVRNPRPFLIPRFLLCSTYNVCRGEGEANTEKKWGCWFYDCNNPCKCQVVKNDASCKDCSAGQCHA